MSNRTITVLSTRVIKQGEKDGKPWTLRSVEATNEDGTPIVEQLKSFADLKGTLEVEVERQEHEKYGVSFMLKPVKSNGGRSGGAGAAAGELAALRGRVDRLEAHVKRLSSIVDRRDFQPPSEAGPVGNPAGAPADF